MIPLSRTRTGELIIFSEAFLWSLFPVISILTLGLMSPLYSASLSTFASCLFFAIVITVKKGWHQCSRAAPWIDILQPALFIGVIYYGLIFTGLKHTTAGNASIMGLMEVFFSFVILGLLVKHERVRLMQVVGALCMVAGAVLVLLPKATGWHSGDLWIVAATAFAPLGNRAAKKAREQVSAEFIMFIRSLVGACFLLVLAFCTETMPAAHALYGSLGFILVNGFLLLGFSKILWIEGTHLLPITKAISLASIAPLFTLLFAFFLLHEQVQAYQIAAFIPILLGVWLLTRESTPSAELTGS